MRHGDAADDDDVVVEQRAVFGAEAQIGADVRGDVVLKDERLAALRSG